MSHDAEGRPHGAPLTAVEAAANALYEAVATGDREAARVAALRYVEEVVASTR